MTLGDRLKTLRSEYGYTQKQVSSMLEIDRGTYGNYEKNLRVPPFDVMVRFVKLFNISMDRLTDIDTPNLGKTDHKNFDEILAIDKIDSLRKIALELASNNEMLKSNNIVLRKKLIDLSLKLK